MFGDIKVDLQRLRRASVQLCKHSTTLLSRCDDLREKASRLKEELDRSNGPEAPQGRPPGDPPHP